MAVKIVGAGLAGSEAAWQLAQAGIEVTLIEMRPTKLTKAHRTGKCAELVCSNSLRGASLTNAVGLLKEELRVCGSLIMEAADTTKVPAGGALAVDRQAFSEYIDSKIRSHKNIHFVEAEEMTIACCSRQEPVIIASGPLTSENLASSIVSFLGTSNFSFFDAISPIILGESLDQSKVFRQSRYDKGDSADYLNIPLDKDSYYKFVDEVSRGEKFGEHNEVEADQVDHLRPFEGCMPIESMLERGIDTLLFGPMKPVGLIDPRTNRRPYAIVQLRQDDRAGQLWSMVGFQTKLKHPEQVRIFRMLPGLENAEFVRLGSVHRNSFIDSPKCLNAISEAINHPGLFFAGQITGVEGYVESTASGFVVAHSILSLHKNQEPQAFPVNTAIGSLLAYISDKNQTNFQPMNISFGLMPTYLEQESTVESNGNKRKISKSDRRMQASNQALTSLKAFLAQTAAA